MEREHDGVLLHLCYKHSCHIPELIESAMTNLCKTDRHITVKKFNQGSQQTLLICCSQQVGAYWLIPRLQVGVRRVYSFLNSARCSVTACTAIMGGFCGTLVSMEGTGRALGSSKEHWEPLVSTGVISAVLDALGGAQEAQGSTGGHWECSAGSGWIFFFASKA